MKFTYTCQAWSRKHSAVVNATMELTIDQDKLATALVSAAVNSKHHTSRLKGNAVVAKVISVTVPGAAPAPERADTARS